MKRKLKGLMGFLLSLALVMGLMPGMSVKANEPIAFENYILTLYKNDGTVQWTARGYMDREAGESYHAVCDCSR